MNSQIAYFYRQERARQMALANEGCGTLTSYQSGRTEMSYGGAPYDEHAVSAWLCAKRRVYFRRELSNSIKIAKRRSAAAKRGWKTRRQNAG